ncbi:unnamed protein product [Periconia digitata]|uniref:Structural maintenance of chromosomes protein 5 n=1 Tax=Periconia digitata TaxID=1303443 RepID=A0A9W4U2Q6_9PLEO|nr:unnamed protein product [Periconia digitata]
MSAVRKNRKRPVAALSDGDQDSDDSQTSAGSKRSRRDAPEEVHDSHIPGSLVRVKLTNFVTYTAAEFNLGPSLNMIIGPNGTGKSTLVCAICLGLGWSPQNLGRAKDIGEFVKHGQSDAEIEIELAAAPGDSSNPIVRRLIRKEGNKSMFFIHKRPVPQKEVVALARSFSIQIDNLCQFLPQDRVVEFARLDPIALLRETQRAAAPAKMVEWHDQLKQLRTNEKSLEAENQDKAETLKRLQIKQNATREDVERWNERVELTEKSQMLEKCRPIIAAKLLQDELRQIKAELVTHKNELRNYEAEVEPLQRSQEETEQYRDRVAEVANSRKQRFEAGQGAVKSFATKIDAQHQVMEAVATEIEGEKQIDKQRNQDFKRVEMEIRTLQTTLDDGTPEYDASGFESRQKDIRTRKSALDRRQVELVDNLKRLRPQVEANKQSQTEKIAARKQLDTQMGKKGEILRKMNEQMFRAWNWLEQNKASLQLHDDVYAPPILCCSIPDPDYASAVESQLRPPDLFAITCTNPHDAKIVQNKLVGTRENGGLELHKITIRTVPNVRPAPPVSREELHRLGFHSWIIDHIVGPDPVLNMLCNDAKLHASAFAPRTLSPAQFAAVQQSRIRKWVSGNEVCQISTRKEYGISSTNILQIKPAKYFTGQSVDTEEKDKLDAEILGLKHELELLKEQHQEYSAQHKDITDAIAQADAEKAEVQSEQEQIANRLANWQAIPRKIEGKEAKLETLKNAMAESHNLISSKQTKWEQASIKAAQFTLQYAKQVIQLRSQYEDFLEAEIRLIEANSEIDGYKSDNHTIRATLSMMRGEVERLDALKRHTTAKAKEQLGIANRIIQDVSAADQEAMHQYSNLPSADALDEEISRVMSRLELMSAGNPNAVKAFEKREEDIKSVEEALENSTQQLQATRDMIQEIRGKWEPRLDALANMISNGFAHNLHQIGCAGQVSVYKDEDFGKWAIQIQVRFRENESLSILDSHRQSGGERAVSTIFYLMALQDLARSPFRVVDEINQGMDPRNERMVHERMVDIACRERTSQYFLVTPKLLNNLKFHPKMKVHCIASGEHMPDQNTNLDFQRLAKVALRVRKNVVAAA